MRQQKLILFCTLISFFSLCWSCEDRFTPLKIARTILKPEKNGFKISLFGNPDKYIPHSMYSVMIDSEYVNFNSFVISSQRWCDNDDEDECGDPMSPDRAGSLQVMTIPDIDISFHPECINTLVVSSPIEENKRPKVEFVWVAPKSGSGCVYLRAIMSHSNQPGVQTELLKELCEMIDSIVPPPIEEEKCCACDEAVYEMKFEGLWSSDTHPKDYPTSLWLVHFSDIMGASHDKNYSLFTEGQWATDGVRQLAEWGSTGILESELRQQKKHLRSLIKAPGLWYPRVNTNTTTKFRVDRKHHFMSMASMIGPSPDWFVGVNGYNLCEKNCKWAKQRTIDLYAYDAGTDSGRTYMSHNQETLPHERLYRITSMYPDDPRSPFFDEQGREIPPLARLHLNRINLIPKSCSDKIITELVNELIVNENAQDILRPECTVSKYSEWSECNVSCGKGLRSKSRHYLNETAAKITSCDRQLVAKEMCLSSVPICPGETEQEDDSLLMDDSKCNTTDWTPMSECSVSCGIGFMMRTRQFLDHSSYKKCRHISLVMKKKCMMPACTKTAEETNIISECPVTEWSTWSPCNVNCGQGISVRSRLLLVSGENFTNCLESVVLEETKPCIGIRPTCEITSSLAKEICSMDKNEGACNLETVRYYYDRNSRNCLPFKYRGCRGNENNFKNAKECRNVCKNVF
ncbi:spondin-1 [Daktulosphaira vitifoliae]|uniref:spondin-1 n=1 Tax=Daktulosphaira vitifoliae TaxID=58002 RepID=UPI0021A9EF4F|nr:spondin-1 [Daktulosphaira vitifoliae]